MVAFSTCSSAIELDRMGLAEDTLEKMQEAVKTLIHGVGEDPSREGLLETPRRVAKAWLDMTSGGGREQCQKAFGQALFHEPLLTASPDGIVLVRDISFASLSQDTLLPFHGKVNVAYLPQHGVVLGLSKLARATRCLSGKVQRVEQLAADLMAAIQQEISPKGVFVTVQATLLGYGAEPASKETSAACGSFANEGSGLCDEVRLLLGRTSNGNTNSNLTGGGGSSKYSVNLINSTNNSPTTITTATASPAADGEAVLLEPPTSMVSAVEALLRGIGEDPYKENLKGSADRYIRWLQGATAGYAMKLPVGCTCGGTGCDDHFLETVREDSLDTGVPPETEEGHDLDSCTRDLAGVYLAPATPDLVSSDTSSDDAHSSLGDGGGAGGGGGGVGEGGIGSVYVSLREERGPVLVPNGVGNNTSSLNNGDGRRAGKIGKETTTELPALSVLSVRFTSQCEHHLLPFYGTIKIGYTLSSTPCSATQAAALSQVVEVFSRRLQVQERLTQQIADAAAAVVGPEQDVLVLCESAHMCMVARGVEEHASATLTTGARGLFAENGGARRKALEILLGASSS